jgi:hypothetical protein
MMKVRGTLNILRTFRDELEDAGIYDVTFSMEERRPSQRFEEEPQRCRRFYGEQELAEFLTKHMGRNAEEAVGLVKQVRKDGRARIQGLEVEDLKLKSLHLAA